MNDIPLETLIIKNKYDNKKKTKKETISSPPSCIDTHLVIFVELHTDEISHSVVAFIILIVCKFNL